MQASRRRTKWNNISNTYYIFTKWSIRKCGSSVWSITSPAASFDGILYYLELCQNSESISNIVCKKIIRKVCIFAWKMYMKVMNIKDKMKKRLTDANMTTTSVARPDCTLGLTKNTNKKDLTTASMLFLVRRLTRTAVAVLWWIVMCLFIIF